MIIAICKETMTPIDTVYDWPVGQTFYLGSYIVNENEKQRQELLKIKNNHHR